MIAVGPRMGYLLYVGVKKSGQVWVIILLDTEFRYGGGQAARNSAGGGFVSLCVVVARRSKKWGRRWARVLHVSGCVRAFGETA
jgi:hypothetical protein